MLRCARGVALTAVVALALCADALAATYPSPPPDFSHPGRVHYGDRFFSRLGGQADRPILVIYVRWNDVDYPDAFPASVVSQRFFGTGFPSLTFPSVGDYFRRTSSNDLFVFPAPETQGTPYDGVVQVRFPSTKATFLATPYEQRNRQLLQLVDPYVDFEELDLDSDGKVTDEELIVNAYEAAPETPLWKGCGVQAGTNALTLDGKALGSLRVAMTNTSTNLMTIVHENAHVALGMKDLYGFDTAGYDIGSFTCEGDGSMPNDGALFAPNAWHKLHWGWITPTVVTRDGYHDVRRADTSGDAFILYDPDKGTDHYLIVENRQGAPGTYDQGIPLSGLVVWRVADHAFGVAVGHDPIGLVRAPNMFPAWSARLTARTATTDWLDGTSSPLAVRAIGRNGDVMRAYFDVRGPGILVDTYPVDQAAPVGATAGGRTTIDVPVTNTGESGCDTFVFEPVVPAGWGATAGARILCAGESTFARMTVTPDANATPGVHTIGIRGRSANDAAVSSEAPLRLDVVLRPTKLGLGALAVSGATDAPTTFEVRVAEGDGALEPALAGVSVTFTLSGAGGTIVSRAVSDASGVARATVALDVPPGLYTLTIETDRSGAFAATRTTVPYTVERRPTTVAYTGVSQGEYSDPAALSATLVDALTGAPLTGRQLRFAVGPQAAVATTGSDGAAATAVTLDQPAADVAVSASFEGDATYLPAVASSPFAVAPERLSFAYTGDVLAGAGVTPTLAAAATQEDDGSPGDLTRAAAAFLLTPSLGSAAFDVTAPVGADGSASVLAAGLTGDLWRVAVRVPAANRYWTGSSAADAEALLATDSTSCATAAGGFRTSGGAKVELSIGCAVRHPRTLRAMFHLDAPGTSFLAKSLTAFGVSADGTRAYGAGTGADGGTFVVLVRDERRADRFDAWLRGRRVTGDGTLASGNVTVDAR